MRLKGKTYKNITDNQELSYSYSYNTIGQLDTVVYPFGFAIKHEYDSDGRLSTIKRVGNSSCLYDMYYYTKWNTPHLWRSGNMLTVLYHNQAGLPITKVVGNSEINRTTETLNLKDSSIQYFQYVYDDAGRISHIYRTPAQSSFHLETVAREVYRYDNMDRLLSAEKWRQNPTGNYGQIIRDTFFTITYNKNLIKSNSTIGNYTYNHPSKPHALTQVEPFDETTISANTCNLTYTAFNKVKTINEGDYFYDIRYYPNKNQAVTTLKEKGTIISQKQYAGKAFEIDYATNTKYFYVYAHGQPIAVFIQQGENAIQPYFIHTDHLGSVDKITDKDGNVVDSMSFDAWGNRRNRNNWQLREGNVVHLIDRGFTMHQHLDVFNLINMGGRVYDPDVQQFLSPDPYVQMPDNTQNLNRYAYCLNSPTMYVDPTGEFFLTFVINAIAGHVRGENGWKAGGDAIANQFKILGGLFTTDKNRNFWGQTWEFISRFTWQGIQTAVGHTFAQFSNTFAGVSKVAYSNGATVLFSRWIGGGVTLGSYITGGENSIEADPANSLFQHEYGHYLQSQATGPFYLPRHGIPSALSRGNHDYHPVEQDANARAYRYFSEHIKDFNWKDENEVQRSKWNFKYNLIIGYNPALPFDNEKNQLALKHARLRISWVDWVTGPSVIENGIRNTFVLNNQDRYNVKIRTIMEDGLYFDPRIDYGYW